MGLVPSREALHEAATSPHTPLPYISRPVEGYVYRTNRTERTFGSGVPGVVTGVTPLPAALPSATTAVLHGASSLELSQKVVNELPKAVFIDDPAEASATVAAAVAANRPARRGGGGGAGGQKAEGKGEGFGNAAGEESATAHALRAGKVPFVYYYEHRVLPLTKEYFPSPDCILFQQLWHARQQQNPRYHFQLDQTWSPGALMDPTAHYESFMHLAASSLTDVQAACLTAAGTAPTRGSVLQAQADLEAARAELRVAGMDPQHVKGGPGAKAVAASPVPLATREEFYNLVVRTTEDAMLYDTDDALRNAVQSAAEGKEDVQRKRLRPVPCAIVLVRRCMAAQKYRYTYYLASHERHHRVNDNAAVAAADATTGTGPKASSGRRRAGESQQREAQTIAVTGSAVRTAVEEAQRALLARPDTRAMGEGGNGEESLMVPWLQVSAPQAPLDLAEVRVVGMYGCWTMEEILRHCLFVPAAGHDASMERGGNAAAVGPRQPNVQDAETRAKIDAVLCRACPHGVPSSTLINVGFFEKQVGDKEQCHTYFSLCRLFAHGMRECILRDVICAASVSVLETTLGGDDTGDGPIDAEVERARMEAQRRDLKRQQEHPTWQKFLRLLAAEGSSGEQSSVFADLSNCFLIRFSYVPQLQLCRQLRLLLTGMASMYPEPISLDAFQAAQRQRNMVAMARKQKSHTADADERGAAGVGKSARGGAAPPPARPASMAETVFTPLGDLARPSPSHPTANAADPAGTASRADVEPQKAEATRQQQPSQPPAGLGLDPEAIAERYAEHASEAQKLRRDGFCCYASDGLVVFRVSRGCVARALNQLGFAFMKDSIEALCVTLTAAAPPSLTYRGELRPPVATGCADGQAWEKSMAITGSMRDDGDTVNGGGDDACEDEEQPTVNNNTTTAAAAAAAAISADGGGAVSLDLTTAAVRELYCNAVRYSSDAATGFAAQRLFIGDGSGAGAGLEVPSLLKAPPLEQTPSHLIGVLPRNPIEQRRGRLLPLRGLLLQEARVNHLHVTAAVDAAAGPDAAAHAKASLVSSQQQQQQQLLKVNEQQQFDVYTVSEAFDGVPFRQLMELTHQVEHQRHTLCGSAGEEWPEMFIESVDAQGNTEFDSVLSWSPMASLVGRARLAGQRKAVGGPDATDAATATAAAVNDEANNGEESTTTVNLSQTQSSLGGKTANPVTVPIRVHDPDRVLHTGDRIRFAICQGATPQPQSASGAAQGLRSLSGEVRSPLSTSAELPSPHSTIANTPNGRLRRAGSITAAATYGYWYVDDSLTTEDMVLSWMRRVSGRARETRGSDTKWVRYPSEVLSVVQQFVRVCRQKPSGSWLNTGHPLRLLHPMDDELVESDMLQNFPDIMRTRRFRQWRFSHDGYVYFHGVTVRMPGSVPPLQAALLSPSSKTAVAAAQPDTKTSPSVNHRKPPSHDDRTPVWHANTVRADAGPTSTRMPASPAAQQQQQQQQNAFAGVPRPPPVMQCGVYGNGQSHMEGAYGNPNPYHHHNNYQGNVSPQMVYPMSSFNPNVLPGQQHPPPQQVHRDQQQYQQVQHQQMPPPQTYYYPNPINVNGGVPLQQPPHPPQQPSNVTMYVPVTYAVEPYYMPQPANVIPIPQPPAHVAGVPPDPGPSNSFSSNNNTLYFDEADVTSAQSRSIHNNGNSGRSPHGDSQPMHFSLHHMDSDSSLRSYDLAPSTVMPGPTHVTGSFYGELCGQSPQQPPPATLQQQQQLLTSLSSAGVRNVPDYRNEVCVGSGSDPSQGAQTPDGSAWTSAWKPHEGHKCLPTAGADLRNNTAGSHRVLSPLSSHVNKPPLSSNIQQQLHEPHCDAVGRGSGVPGGTASRRSTADYPPRRIGTTFLAGNSNNSSSSGSCGVGGGRGAGPTTVMRPTVQRAVSQPIQTSHVDPTAQPAATTADEIGAPLCLPIPKSRISQSHVVSGVLSPLSPTAQQQQGPGLTSPLLSPTLSSFRESAAAATTADVIEADGITVHVMQRKSSLSARRTVASVSVLSPVLQHVGRHSSYGGGAQAQQTSSNNSSLHNCSANDAATPCYGAMGVSPTGGVDAITATAPTTVTSPEDGAGASASLTYEMPAVLTPMSNSRSNSFAAGASGGLGNRSTSRIGGGSTTGAATSPQRHRSLRVSHNPYATRDVSTVHGAAPFATPTLAHGSSYHGGGGVNGSAQETRGAQSGQDAFQAALDAQYGGGSDFGAAGAVSPLQQAQKAPMMGRSVSYSRSGTGPVMGTPVGHSSFYAVAGEEEAHLSYSSHEMYRDKIAEGTTQGFYYSMDGPHGSDGSAAQQLYGRDDSVAYPDGSRQEGSFNCPGSAPYNTIPAPPALPRAQRGSY